MGIVVCDERLLESGGQLYDPFLEAVFRRNLRRDLRHHQVLVAERNCVGDPFAFCVLCHVSLCSVPLHGSADAPSDLAPEVPGVACAWFVVCNELLAERSEGRRVVIKQHVEELPRRDAWIERGPAKEVELDDGLRDEEIPQEAWEVRGHTHQHSEEVSFEGAYGPLRRVALVNIGWDELKLGPPSLRYLFFIGCDGLVLQDLKVYIVALLYQRFHNHCIGF